MAAANAAREQAGLEPLRAKFGLHPMRHTFGLHPMRHTFGAMLRRAGVSKDNIADYLGHSRAGGVTDTYTPGIEQEATALEHMTAFAAYLTRSDTAARVAQLDLVEQLAEAERKVAELRERPANGERASWRPSTAPSGTAGSLLAPRTSRDGQPPRPEA